jgi:hypothetical protein
MVSRALPLILASTFAMRGAYAEPAKLVEARAALAAVQYDKARMLLVGALGEGTATPAEVAEIYRLSASTATVLGDREVAEQYYRRWLALEPAATLPSSVAPKLREPFVAAQAYMAAHGRLSVKAQRHATHIAVVLEADPLTMAARVSLDDSAPVAFDAARHAKLDDRGTAQRVVVRDEFGNALVELETRGLPAVLEPQRPQLVTPAGPSLVRHPAVWGILTVAAGVTSLGFGLAAQNADDDLANIVANSKEHTLADAEAARDRRDRYGLVANIGFVATGVFAVTTAIMFVTRPEQPTRTVVPTATSSGVGISVVGSW